MLCWSMVSLRVQTTIGICSVPKSTPRLFLNGTPPLPVRISKVNLIGQEIKVSSSALTIERPYTSRGGLIYMLPILVGGVHLETISGLSRSPRESL